MGEITVGVNWIAVIAGTILAYLLGWVWYSPKLFGRKWAEGVGIELNESAGPPLGAMLTQLVGTFLLALIIGVTAVADALLTAILVVLTIVVLMSAGGLFCQKSRQAITTETGFVVVMAIIMIVCQGVL